MKTNTSPATFPQAEIGREMKGADCVVECLTREGVDVIFAYPGGASQELHQALARTDKIRVILPRHEQGGSFAAEGFSRVTGKTGVCMATSGPGATNLISAIADAYMDSVPMVAITGQVFSKFIGKMAFQETDFFGMTLPIVKHSYLVIDVHDLPRIFKEAFHLARTGRPGPVIIDLPKDVQQAKFQPVFPATTEFRNPAVIGLVPRATDEQLKPMLGLDRRGQEARDLCRRRHHLGRRPRRTEAVRGKDQHRGGHHLDGLGRVSGKPSAVPALVRHARQRLWQLGGGPVRSAHRGRCAVRRPHHGGHEQIRGGRQDRPHRPRRLRAQQEQADRLPDS